MKSLKTLSIILFSSLFFLIFTSFIYSSQLLVGDKAPDFTVATLSGDSITLRQYRGSVVIVHLWSPTCPHCRETNKTLPEIVAPYKNSNLAYVMIAIDSDTSTLRPVIKEDKLNFAIHAYDPYDGAAKTMLAYEAPGTPSINIVDEKGNLVAANVTSAQLKKYLKKHFPLSH
jgi:peroxiredoxin